MAPVAVMLNLRADALTAAQSSPLPVTNWCYSCPIDSAYPADISEMEQAALHRMAKSIAQLTLCQVTGKEIETATKLLEKACQKLRGIPEVPPQRVTDLDNATRQVHQLSCILDSCIISASYESQVKHRKLCCYCPVLKKDLALLRKSTTPTCRTPLTRISFMSTRILFDAEDRQSTPERNLSGLWAPVGFLSFHPRSVFIPHFTISHFYFPFATWQCHCWLLDRIKVSTRMLPVRPALCDLEAPCWGSLGFRLCPCCFPAQRLLYGIFGILLFRSCFLLPYQSLGWYNDIIFSSTLQMPVNCSADHRPCWFLVCFLGVFVCFVWFWVFVVCFFV